MGRAACKRDRGCKGARKNQVFLEKKSLRRGFKRVETPISRAKDTQKNFRWEYQRPQTGTETGIRVKTKDLTNHNPGGKDPYKGDLRASREETRT